MTTFQSFSRLRNIPEQTANPAGVRRIGVVAVADLETTREWPTVGFNPVVETEAPLKPGGKIAVITPADNSVFMEFEQMGERYYQYFRHSTGFELAGLTQEQAGEMRKYLNTGVVLFLEYNDGDIRVVGTRLKPVGIKAKGATGKKGGDKRGYTITADNDNYISEPPFYPEAFALPGMKIKAGPKSFSTGFSNGFY